MEITEELQYTVIILKKRRTDSCLKPCQISMMEKFFESGN